MTRVEELEGELESIRREFTHSGGDRSVDIMARKREIKKELLVAYRAERDALKEELRVCRGMRQVAEAKVAMVEAERDALAAKLREAERTRNGWFAAFVELCSESTTYKKGVDGLLRALEALHGAAIARAERAEAERDAARAEERKAVVAWLEAWAAEYGRHVLHGDGPFEGCGSYEWRDGYVDALDEASTKIEAGEHLKGGAK